MNPPKLQSLYALWRLANEMEKFAMPTETPYNDMAAMNYYSETDVRLWARQLADAIEVCRKHATDGSMEFNLRGIKEELLFVAGDEKT